MLDHSSIVQFFLGLDRAILLYINSFALRYPILDQIVVALCNETFLKGSLPLTVFWWLWFRTPEKPLKARGPSDRDILVYTLLISVPTVLFARLLAHVVPFRLRPIWDPALPVRVVASVSHYAIDRWSSFPSDHAALFTLLATGVFLVSRRLGVLLYLHTLLFVLLPRIYLGIHYPSDILGGCLIGILAASTVYSSFMRSIVCEPALAFLKRSPAWFYALFFLLASQTADIYNPIREIGVTTVKIIRAMFHAGPSF